MTQMPITINGNLTSDPVFRHFNDTNATLCKFRVATSRRYPTKDTDSNNNPIWQDTDNLYLDVECWGQLAINASASLRRGLPVLVSGYLVTDVWDQETQTDSGEKVSVTRYTNKVRAARIGFELSNFQVSSVRSSNQANTLDGQQPVVPLSTEDILRQQSEAKDGEREKQEVPA